MSEKADKWWTKLIILGIFVGIVAVTAKVDWAAEESTIGMGFRLGWLFGLMSLGLILPIAFMYLAGNTTRERGESDKKWFILALVLYAIANGIPLIFYMVLDQAPGFFLFLQLGLFGLIPAFILQPQSLKMRYLILIILFAMIIVPLTILVNLEIGNLWLNPTLDKMMYYLFFWGLFSVFLYLIIAIGWKFGGGRKRQSWNIFLAGMLIQFSTLEDFFYYYLNGQTLPGTWP
ncbi:MAG: hypothetical protein HWN65_17435 [Candidatus Helarchaeota archaeon]|nr:hypothetical protein [Candidatus Helarchaeota archaeon]